MYYDNGSMFRGSHDLHVEFTPHISKIQFPYAELGEYCFSIISWRTNSYSCKVNVLQAEYGWFQCNYT